MSVERANGWRRKRSMMEQRLFRNGGPIVRQSFNLAELPSPLQLQSYTILMGVVVDSFLTG